MEQINGYMRQIRDFLDEDGPGALGIYGMGGIGKTTLLWSFDCVIFVTVAADPNVLKVQEKIRERLDLDPPSSKAPSSQTEEEKWEVTTLNDSQAWILFQNKVGRNLDHDSSAVYQHAKAIVRKCGGLPLALEILDRTMADARSIGDWRDAARDLQVLSLLRFNFYRLTDDCTRQCFLYCCLFKEDDEIKRNKLILYWIGEGLIEQSSPHKGRKIINNLISASLLQRGYSDDLVKMHDVVRDMCLWLSKGDFIDNIINLDRWQNVKRVQCMDTTLYSIPKRFFQRTPSLHVLQLQCFISENTLKDIASLLKLRYLDLLGIQVDVIILFKFVINEVQYLPNNIMSLIRLQFLYLSLTNLQHLLGSIGSLIKLKEFNVSSNKLQSLSNTIGSLVYFFVKLKELDLSFTKLQSLPNTIRSLVELENLDLFSTKLDYLLDSLGSFLNVSNMKLQSLSNIIISLVEKTSVRSLLELQIFDLSYTKLNHLSYSIGFLVKLKYLNMSDIKLQSLPSTIKLLAKLEKLHLGYTNLNYFLDSIKSLLQKLDLSSTKLDCLPIFINYLVKLKELNLSFTKLQCLPSTIRSLMELEKLYKVRLTMFGTKLIIKICMITKLSFRFYYYFLKLEGLNLSLIYQVYYLFCCEIERIRSHM
ncbi:unnamed protein product [Spirodela intermedia]|uniref:Uncharacterized protein n=1 Tax=Spirodela intermedia TaxID=51605 RepID=A0A7I8L6D2_SPIIN|nr:unnamed protein product [Spirodela intermedia]